MTFKLNNLDVSVQNLDVMQ